MDELTKKDTTMGTPASNPNQTTQTQAQTSYPSVGGNITDGQYSSARIGAVNQMYDAQRAAREAELKSAYDQSLLQSQAAQEKIAPQYQRQANELAAQNERNRQNFMRQAAASGINTGVSAQESLARQGQYLGAVGNLRTAEADAQAAIQRQQAQLLAQYQSNVAAALAENDYQRAGALLDEYNNGYQRDLQNAQNLAQYGDFSLFSQLYGQDRADSMLALWIAQNPDLAYNSGRINEEQYKVITGNDPVGFTATGVTLKDLVDGRIPEGKKNGTAADDNRMDWFDHIGWTKRPNV